MNTWERMGAFGLGCWVLGGACWGAAGASRAESVGNRPGDVSKRLDSDATARKRGHELAMFGAGCFWGVEDAFRKVSGVTATAAGFTGGSRANPTYEEVCAGKTGHCEAVLVEFDPRRVSYDRLLSTFFSMHDASRKCPIGYQYRSAIFTFAESQRTVAIAGIQAAKKRGLDAQTEIAKAGTFWLAELYHQQYYDKHRTQGKGKPER